jgi:hypothetical protein
VSGLLNRPRTWVVIGLTAVATFLLYELVWVWMVERVEVPPDQFLVRISLWGHDLPEGEVVAPDDSYKGVQREVLPEGRHFLNPLLWTYERHKVTAVPPGKCLVLTRKAGKEISADRLAKGEYLAGDDERGIVREVLLPGKHRINPYLYHAETHDAVEIKAHEVGVRTLKWGKDPAALRNWKNPYVVPAGYRGIQEKAVPPGTYYLNPYVESILPVDTRSHRVEFGDIVFPSRDGFTIQPHVLVSYKVRAEMAPEVYVTLSDEGRFHQRDTTDEEKKKNQILQKVVLPLIRGVVRVEGSKYDARDYISQQKVAGAPAALNNPRVRLQEELLKRVVPECEKMGIVIDAITLAELETSRELRQLADQISERERARVMREQNKKLVEKYTQEQEQKAKEALAEQKREVVVANTKLTVEQTNALRAKEVEESKLRQELKAAQARLDAARDQARAALTKGKAEAAVVTAQNEAKVADLKTAVAGFPSPDTFAQYHVLTRLAPSLAEIFASDTSDFAKLFSAYMTPGDKPLAARPAPSGKSVAKPGR